jgi:transposase
MAGRASNCCAPACCRCEPEKLHREPGRTQFRKTDIRVQERVKAKPDSTLTELCAWLRQEHQMEASVALMAKTLSQLGLTLKKRRSMQLNRTGRMWPRNALPGGTDRPPSTRPN